MAVRDINIFYSQNKLNCWQKNSYDDNNKENKHAC